MQATLQSPNLSEDDQAAPRLSGLAPGIPRTRPSEQALADRRPCEPLGKLLAGRPWLGGVRLPFEKLDGTSVADLRLAVEEDAEESSPHPVRILAERGEARWPILEGQTNPGTAWRHPWLEVRFEPWVGGRDEGQALTFDEQLELFDHLGEVLVPGAYVMLSCDGHPASLRALSVDVPPACTALGYLLWAAGARWYKVWYFPEGWREGHEKVQGNLPADEEHAAERTRERLEEIESFLGTELAETYPECAQRGRQLLDAHAEHAPDE